VTRPELQWPSQPEASHRSVTYKKNIPALDRALSATEIKQLYNAGR
jgi:hypothetical protein